MLIAMVSMHTSPADRPGTGDAGGLNVYVLESAKALAALGHRVDIYTRSAGAPSSRTIAQGVTLYALETGGGVVRKHDLPNLSDEFGQQLQEAALRATHAYDVIHCHYWLSGLAALPVSLALDVPIVQTFHTLAAAKDAAAALADREPHAQLPRESERRTRTEQYLAQEADAIVAVSTAEVDVLLDAVGAEVEDVWLVHPGVDTERFTPASVDTRERMRALLDVPDGASLVTVAGRIQPLKGQELAIETLARVPDAVLAIAGEPTPGDGNYLESLHVLAQDLGVADRVRFVGGLDQDYLAQLYGASALVLVPSHFESFGLVALEAAACGTPVVAANVGGLPEAVAAGVSGLLIAERDPDAWAAAVMSILDDPLAAVTISAQARSWAEQHRWSAAATSLEAVYQQLQP